MEKKKIGRLTTVLFVTALVSVLGLAFMACTPVAPDEIETLNIIYTSDTHGNLSGSDDTVGMSAVSKIKSAHKNSILVDAGDFLHGQPVANLFKGESVIDIMTSAGYNYTAVGNHEFNYGPEELKKRKDEAELKNMFMTSANVYLKNGYSGILGEAGERVFKPYLINTIRGITIGIIGVSTPETVDTAYSEYIKDFEFRNPVTEVVELLKDPRLSTCDLVVVLSHLGSDINGYATSKELAEKVGQNELGGPERSVDIIIDGHSHKILDDTIKSASGKPVVRVSPGSDAQNVGVLTLSYNKTKKQTVSYSNKLIDKEASLAYGTSDEIENKLYSYNAKLNTELSKVQFNSADLLVAEETNINGGIDETVRFKETNLGNLTADAMVWAGRQSGTNGIDIALINGGDIRANLPSGSVTLGNILSAYQYTSELVVQTLSVAQIKQVLEHSAKDLLKDNGDGTFSFNQNGKFLQVSGLEVTFMRSGSSYTVTGLKKVDHLNNSGSEIDLMLPANSGRAFKVMTTRYLATGGDGYSMLKEIPTESITVPENVRLLEYAVIEYAKEKSLSTNGILTGYSYVETPLRLLGLTL